MSDIMSRIDLINPNVQEITRSIEVLTRDAKKISPLNLIRGLLSSATQ
jgi:hypothetical protein